MESIDQINKSITETQTKISEIEEKIKNIGFFIWIILFKAKYFIKFLIRKNTQLWKRRKAGKSVGINE